MQVLYLVKLPLYLTYRIILLVKQKELFTLFSKSPYLTAPMFRVDVTRHWESSLQDFLGVIQRSLQ